MILAFLLPVQGCSHMDTDAQPQRAVLPLLQFMGAWGIKGNGPGQLDEPTDMTTDALGNVFIADGGSHFVDKFDPQGTPLLSFQDPWIRYPDSIAIDRGGAIYVADATQHGVFIFLPSGDRYRGFRVRSRLSAEDALDVAVSDDGLIFVLDTNSGEILAYTPRARLVRTWRVGGNGSKSNGHASAIAWGPDGYLYVLDSASSRILRFTEEGRFVSEIVMPFEGLGRKLGDEFVVSSSAIFVMDGDGLTLHVSTLDGKPKLDLDLSSKIGQTSRFIPPLAIGPHAELLILDEPAARVLRYRINF
jgi:DNA-binding beta-propeller fold protein YncE